jgi:hypothetical protein
MPTKRKPARTHARASQTNAIILRIRKDKAKEFERLFAAEEMPIWKDFHARGKLRAASLTRVEYGSEEDDAKKGEYANYILYAVMADMRAHLQHDRDERFNAFLKKAQRWQPEGPSVWGGKTLFRMNAE